MRSLFAIAVLVSLAATALAGLTSAPIPNGFSIARRASPNRLLSMIFGVERHGALDRLRPVLEAVSDVSSPSWGKFLTREQTEELSRPTRAAVEAVKAFIATVAPLESIVELKAGAFLQVELTVAQAEELLQCKYHVFKHEHDASLSGAVRTLAYSLPDELESVISVVGPTIRFPSRLRVQQSAPGTLGVTPSTLRSMYGLGSVANTNASNLQGVGQFLGQYYAPSDLQTFFKKEYPSVAGQTPTVFGPNVASNPGLEASLDIQYIMSIGAKVPTQFWYTPGKQPFSPENEPFLVWLTNVTALDVIPFVLSVSYGDNEDSVNYGYAVSVNSAFAEVGLRGTTLLFSSGDGGVAGSQTSPCHGRFIPTFPAASPYVTSVGGTASSSEAASFSSGGFSNYWPRPEYQDATVAAYLQTAGSKVPAASFWNASGAAFPDVSALGVGFIIVVGGSSTSVDGTSCSSPTMAGVLAQIVGLRLNAGKGPLGWIKQNLYTQPTWQSMLTDVTEGSNPGCGTDGFPAEVGWDPLTGFGQPNFPKMVTVLVNNTP